MYLIASTPHHPTTPVHLRFSYILDAVRWDRIIPSPIMSCVRSFNLTYSTTNPFPTLNKLHLLQNIQLIEDDGKKMRVTLKCRTCSLKFVLSTYPTDVCSFISSESPQMHNVADDTFMGRVERCLEVMCVRDCSIEATLKYEGHRQYV